MTTFEMVSQVLGGIGLFLIGMVLATDGLREAAGDSLRSILLKFTGGPLQAMLSGASVTALVQSSSVTTVATISFVTAGLLTFQQALGLILGANLGTTATGWIVAVVGLKFSVSMIALPLVGVGALMRLFTGGRWKDIGLAIAGFGTLFVGLDVLQAGMAGVSGLITPDTLPSDTWLGRVALMGIGFVLTSLMQSSSAAIAVTLTALHADTISMMQAAAMAIGVNVGTTTTAGLAILGAGTAARRVAFAHLLFNVMTGVVAFLSLPLLVWVIDALGTPDPTLSLAAFHTIFNAVGIAILFPFIGRFSAFVERVIEERGPHLTRRLDPSLADQGGVAIEAVRATVLEMAHEACKAAAEILVERDLSAAQPRIEETREALNFTHDFLASLRDLDSVGSSAQQRHIDVIHALDYLDQLVELLFGDAELMVADTPQEAHAIHDAAVDALKVFSNWVEAPDDAGEDLTRKLESLSERAAAGRKSFRRYVLEETALGQYSAADASRDIDVVRRLDELTFHLWRIVKRMNRHGVPAEMPDDSSDMPDDSSDDRSFEVQR